MSGYYEPLAQDVLDSADMTKSKKFEANWFEIGFTHCGPQRRRAFYAYAAVAQMMVGATLKSRSGWRVTTKSKTGTTRSFLRFQDAWTLADGSELLIDF